MSGSALAPLVSALVDGVVDGVRAQLAADLRGPLVHLGRGWCGLSGKTLKRWAHEGRLDAFVLDERGTLGAWERDIRAAVEAEPMPRGETALDDDDPQEWAADID